jgi:hypothetical protein
MRARIVRTNGTTEGIDLTPGDSLRGMREAIGCQLVDCIEVIPGSASRPGIDIWIDDEGLYAKAPNFLAGAVAAFLLGYIPNYPLFGDVLFTGGADSEGETLGLTKRQAEILADIAGDVCESAREAGLIDS